ncbi:MAG: hypothetical protein M3R39_05285 [Actinomycetota bacterium]|nr:hypothetical protein [Actinomycetota bacterium]
MAWCASSQLKSFGDCRFRFYYGIFPRCSLCPLFDAERAIRDVLGENPPPGMVFEITLGPNLQALLRGEVPLTGGSEPKLEVPDFVPEKWAEPPGDEQPG